MTGLVFELQRDALNSEIKVSELLRKALFISKKLSIVEIEEWINKELNGYSDTDKIPKYRIITGEIKVKNPYWDDKKFYSLTENFISEHDLPEKLKSLSINKSIGELELIVNNSENLLPLSDEIGKYSTMFVDIRKLKFFLSFNNSLVKGILENVKNKILYWSLELDQKGILGEGMSFSEKEKQLAQTVNYITNNIGNMHNSQLQQDSAGATQSLNVTNDATNLKELVEELAKLKKDIDNFGLQLIQKQELQEHISILDMQSRSTKTNNVIIQESKHTIRNIGSLGFYGIEFIIKTKC